MNNKANIKKTAISVVVVLIVGIILACAGLLFAPIIILATIDYGLQDALGFTDTTAILEEQAEYITAEQLSKGRIKGNYASDLEKSGLLVGQIASSGEFIRTNVYIADLEEPRELSSTNSSVNKNGNGQLTIMFDGEIITADNFVAAVESNPKMYAAYSKALNISSRYYYSSEVESVYNKYGFSRNNFSKWKITGDSEADKESFYEIIEDVLGDSAGITLNGYDPDVSDEGNGNGFSLDVSNNNAISLVGLVSEQTKSSTSESATNKAASLLNTAVSSTEPYKSAKTFLLLEESIQRARIDGDGPVNIVMNALSTPNNVTVYDIESGKEKEINQSILGTSNFVAAFSEADFSQGDALNYSRDRVINAIGGVDTESIHSINIALKGDEKYNMLATISGSQIADSNILLKSNTSINNTFYSDPITTFGSAVGGNRIIEGGAFLSNLINLNVLGAMPSDAAQIMSYQKEVEKVLARRAEADRATLSPFDLTSSNTLFGGIARKLSTSYINNINSSFPFLSAIGEVISNSLFVSNSKVDAVGSSSYRTINGKCPTANSIGVEGDLYCNTRNTINTSYMSYTLDDYKNSPIGESLNEDGSIKDNSELAQFVVLGMGREATVGLESADICERWKEVSGNQGLFGRITDMLTNAAGLYQSCRGVDRNIATGANYTLSSTNTNYESVKLYSSYVMYQMVSSLITDSQNQVTAYKERYYSEHPFEKYTDSVLANAPK